MTPFGSVNPAGRTGVSAPPEFPPPAARQLENTAFPEDFRAAFAAFDTLPLAELKAANLQNRVDTKFTFAEAHLVEVLERVRVRYRVVDAFGFTYGRYATLYFDTPQLAMYLPHHNSVRERFKVRVRSYLDTQVSFLEVKRKTNKERTVKTRMSVPFGEPLPEESIPFISNNSPFSLGELQPMLFNEFWRITLVARAEVERITIDVGLRLAVQERSESLDGLVIAEVKQPKFTSRSAFVQEMHRLHIQPLGFSKYAMGVAMLKPGAKANMFKPRIRAVQRLHSGARAHAPRAGLVAGALLPLGV